MGTCLLCKFMQTETNWSIPQFCKHENINCVLPILNIHAINNMVFSHSSRLCNAYTLSLTYWCLIFMDFIMHITHVLICIQLSFWTKGVVGLQTYNCEASMESIGMPDKSLRNKMLPWPYNAVTHDQRNEQIKKGWEGRSHQNKKKLLRARIRICCWLYIAIFSCNW